MSLCRLIYPGLEITQFLVHLRLRIIKFSSTSTHKKRVVKTLVHWAKTVVSEREDRRKELDHLRGALKRNGYLEWILRDLKEENNSDSEKEVETPGGTIYTSMKERSKKISVVIPYVKGFSEHWGKFSEIMACQHILNQQTHCDNCWWNRRIPWRKRMWWASVQDQMRRVQCGVCWWDWKIPEGEL